MTTTTTENTMNINTLFAAIVDTLATAVAAKITPPDVTLAVKEALGDIDLSDVFDIDDKVQEAVRDMDLSDVFDINDKVKDAIGDIDLIDEARVRAIVREEMRAVLVSFAEGL